MSSATVAPTGTHSWSRSRHPTPNLRPSPREWSRRGMCHTPNPTLLRQSAQRADRFRSGPLGQDPRTMDLV